MFGCSKKCSIQFVVKVKLFFKNVFNVKKNKKRKGKKVIEENKLII